MGDHAHLVEVIQRLAHLLLLEAVEAQAAHLTPVLLEAVEVNYSYPRLYRSTWSLR